MKINALVTMCALCGSLLSSACALPSGIELPVVATSTVALSPTPEPVLTAWKSPDGRITLQVPTGWQIEHHEDAGRTLWIWNAPDRRGLVSLLVIASPTLLAEPQRRELLLQAVSQLDATAEGDIQRASDGTLVLEARANGTSSAGMAVPLWVRVSAQQFDDSEAIVVMAMPSVERADFVPRVATVQASLGIVPLPTQTRGAGSSATICAAR